MLVCTAARCCLRRISLSVFYYCSWRALFTSLIYCFHCLLVWPLGCVPPPLAISYTLIIYVGPLSHVRQPTENKPVHIECVFVLISLYNLLLRFAQYLINFKTNSFRPKTTTLVQAKNHNSECGMPLITYLYVVFVVTDIIGHCA